jgi:peptide/nickel transport system ATP-binding protein
MRHPYTEALLASIPHLDQDKAQRLYSIPGLPPDLTQELVGCRFAPRCSYATDICREKEPHLVDAGSDGHQFACHHPIDNSVDALALAARTTYPRPAGAGGAGVASGRARDAGSEAILEFAGVTKEFPVTTRGFLQRRLGVNHAVTDVSLTVHRGDVRPRR